VAISRRHAANKHPGIKVVLLHADAIAQNGASREGAGRVSGNDADGAPLLAQDGCQSVDELTLAPTGGPVMPME